MPTMIRTELPPAIAGPIESIVAAITGEEREQREYDANPHPWSVEADRHRSEIRDRAQRAVQTAAAALDRTADHIEGEFHRLRRSSYDAAEVESAWRRVREALDAGLGISDVLAAGVDRPTAEAIRRNFRSYALATTKSAEDARRLAEGVEDNVLRAEMASMDPAERYATERELARRASRSTIEAIAKYLASPRKAEDMIALGFALDAVGLQPPAREAWDAAVRSVDPEVRAKAERHALPAAARAAMDDNANDVGWIAGRLGPQVMTAADADRLRSADR